MNLGSGLRTVLLANVTVAATVGTRVYPVILPRNTYVYPAIVYRRRDRENEYIFPSPDLNRPTMEVDICALDYPGVRALADVVEQVLDGYRGAMGDATVSSTILRREEEDYGDFDGGGKGLYRVRYWFEISYYGG